MIGAAAQVECPEWVALSPSDSAELPPFAALAGSPDFTGYEINIAADINDIGQIVARGTRVSDGSVVMLVLTPATAE